VIDLLIAGGGPAGLVTALHARLAGMSATVVEPRQAPIDKACGEGLMPSAVTALSALGVSVPGIPFTGIRYLGEGVAAVADFRHGGGLGVRRTDLHLALHRAAAAAGVTFVDDRVSSVSQDASSVTAAGVRARYLVAADGLHSSVRADLGLARSGTASPRWGVRAHFGAHPWTDRVEVYWSVDSEAYVTPVGTDCVGVAVLGGGHAPFEERLAAFPALLERLPSTPVGQVRAAGPLHQHVAARVSGRVLLVGDAAGYVDALTGEGLAIAFACAAALVRRVAGGRPQMYERDYRALTRRYRVITSALLASSRQPVLRRRIVPLAAKAPWLFSAAVNQLAR
jgi:flavin-dependent dehydrogenase